MTDDELNELDQWITPTEAARLSGRARSTIVKYALNTERVGEARHNPRLPELRTMKKGGRARLVFRPDVMRLKGEGRGMEHKLELGTMHYGSTTERCGNDG